MLRGLATAPLLVFLLVAWSAAAAQVPEEHLPARTATMRLAIVGDAGLGTAAVARGIAALQRDAPIDAVLLLGDNFYPRGVRSLDDAKWRVIEPLSGLRLPVFAVLGNHDYDGHIGAQIAATGTVPLWHLPARNYVLRMPLADIAMLDTTPAALDAERLERSGRCPICGAIDAAFSTSHTPWRIAAGHHPIVSSGWHGHFPRSQARRMLRLRPLLREAHVDLYMAGHDHHLEFLRGTPPMLISGAGSDPVPPVALHVQTVYPTEISLNEPVGFALLEISSTTLRLRFYNSRGRALSGWISVAKK